MLTNLKLASGFGPVAPLNLKTVKSLKMALGHLKTTVANL